MSIEQNTSNLPLPPVSLEDAGIHLHTPLERKDHGAIHYTSVEDTVENWAQDPYGEKKYRFFQEAYGIENPKQLLIDSGLEHYVKAKEEGKYVSMIATQITKPTYYFLSNVFMAAELQRKGIPTATLVLDYAEDTFYTGNADKRSAFGDIKFPVDINEDGSIDSVTLTISPYGVANPDGGIDKISVIDEANGYKCSDIYVQVERALDSKQQPYQYQSKDYSGKPTTLPVPEAAVGYSFNGNAKATNPEHDNHYVIPLADFYKHLFEVTIEHLRSSNLIPPEEEFPIFYGNAEKIFHNFMNEANIPAETAEILGFNDPPQEMLTNLMTLSKEQVQELLNIELTSDLYEQGSVKNILANHEEVREEDINYAYTLDDETAKKLLDLVLKNRGLAFDESSGLLYHSESGLPDPASYYGFHIALADLYYECSSCGGGYFVNKVKNGQRLQEAHNLPSIEVKIPDEEIPELEDYCLHPTGRYDRFHKEEYGSHVQERMQSGNKPTKDEFLEIKNRFYRQRFSKLQQEATQYEDTLEVLYQNGFVFPLAVAAWYQCQIDEIDNMES